MHKPEGPNELASEVLKNSTSKIRFGIYFYNIVSTLESKLTELTQQVRAACKCVCWTLSEFGGQPKPAVTWTQTS